jgi:hypothetical protein
MFPPNHRTKITELGPQNPVIIEKPENPVILENIVFRDPEGSEKPFAPHYERFIKPELQAFENKRIATVKTIRQRTIFSLCLIVVSVVMGIIFLPQDVIPPRDAIPLVFTLFVILFACWCSQPILRYRSDVKKTIFPHIFSFFGDDFRYAPESLVGIGSLEPSAILPAYDKAKLTDSIRGSHKNVTLDIVWAHLTRGKGKHNTVFKGVFILLSMNKSFSGQTIVKLENSAKKPPKGLEKVSLEDPRFEADFEVYSSNQIEARYLLTPSLMDRLRGLSDLYWNARWKSKTGNSRLLGLFKNMAFLQASFYNQNLLLMLPILNPKKQSFSTGSIFQPATFTEEIQSILEEMNLIFKIIEELKLHEKTGV